MRLRVAMQEKEQAKSTIRYGTSKLNNKIVHDQFHKHISANLIKLRIFDADGNVE